MSVLSAFAGQPQQALDYAYVALRLSPRDPFAFRIHMASALANILLENYEAVLRSAEQGIAQNPRAIVLFRYKTIALNELGRTKEAQILRDQTLDMMPSFSTHAFIHNIAFSAGVAETLWNRYQELLLRAGFPE